jgi:hypothetical protein
MQEEHILDCGCVQIWTDLQNSYGPQRLHKESCVLHGGSIPYRGSEEEYLKKKVLMLKAEQSELIHLIHEKGEEERAKIAKAEELIQLRASISSIEYENKKLQARWDAMK